MVTRRDALSLFGAAGLCAMAARRGFGADGTVEQATAGWHKFPENPVLGRQYGTCFDIAVIHEDAKFRMWLSWRPKKSIALSESADGIHWSAPEIVLGPNLGSGWEDDINRPSVVHREDGYHMWYTGQTSSKALTAEGHEDGHSAIGYATSQDGKTWVRQSKTPVIAPALAWEGVALMCPDVHWDKKGKRWRMWYSGGAQYEPNAIGHAVSKDGLHWEKDELNPVLRPDPTLAWEQQRVAGVQVIPQGEWFYALYIGYRDIDHAQIGLARSKDGRRDWQRCPQNPIIRASGNGFDADACYKPYAVYAEGKWMLWYNGRNEHLEQIGLATNQRRDLGFSG